jgi:hypothetical protein
MPHLRPLPEQAGKARRVLGRGDDEDVADPREHQRGERVVHHRLVVHGQELLGDHLRHRVEPRARAAREDDALHAALFFASSRYQRTVFASPVSKVSFGFQPSSRWILRESMA